MNLEFYNCAKNNKPLIIVDLDLDGQGCRILFEYYLSKNNLDYDIIQSRISDVDHLEEELLDHDLIVYADLAPTLESYNNLINMGKIVYILDHHESSKERLGNLSNYFYDKTKSATKIVYEFLTEGLPERAIHKGIVKFVNYVNAYDLFLTKTEDFKFGKYLHYILFSHVFDKSTFGNQERGYDNFAELQLRKFDYFKDFTWVPLERKYIQKEVKKEEKALREAKNSYQKRVDSQGLSYGYIELGTKVSLIASMMLEKLDDIDYMVIYVTYKPHDHKFSLRSKGDFNVRAIAEKYNGGGHLNAAGLQLETEELRDKYRKGILHFN